MGLFFTVTEPGTFKKILLNTNIDFRKLGKSVRHEKVVRPHYA